MSLDPKAIFKKAATRAVSSTGNVVSGAGALAASAALWNPLPLVLWALGSAAWVLHAATSQKYTRRVLDEERRATELEADREREALRAKIESALGRRPFARWVRSGLLPDYLRVFARLVTVRDRVAQLLAERREDYLAGLGIQNQLTYLLAAFLQFVQARLALLQTLTDFRPGPGNEEGAPEAADDAPLAAGQAAWQVGPAAAGHAANGPHPGRRVGSPLAPPAPQAPLAQNLAGGRRAFSAPPGSHLRPAAPNPPPSAGGPMAPITARLTATGAPAAGGAAAAPGRGGSPAADAAAELPSVPALLADLDQRIAALGELATSEPATAKTREWHIGILQKQQELLRDCASRDQQLVAQLTAVPDAFDVIAGRISAAQFDAAELAAYTGGVVEQIEETEKFVQTMRPVTDELLQRAPSGVATS